MGGISPLPPPPCGIGLRLHVYATIHGFCLSGNSGLCQKSAVVHGKPRLPDIAPTGLLKCLLLSVEECFLADKNSVVAVGEGYLQIVVSFAVS